MRHDLRTWPEPFEATWTARKVHEIRRMDRAFAVNDELILLEWDPHRDPNARYTGRQIHAVVTHVTLPDNFGLPSDLCVMSIRVLTRTVAGERATRGGEAAR